jgi:hypothetical protein
MEVVPFDYAQRPPEIRRPNRRNLPEIDAPHKAHRQRLEGAESMNSPVAPTA